MTLDPRPIRDTHTIRLRGPWRLEAVYRYTRQADGRYARSAEQLPPPVKATMPADWGKPFGPGFLGRVRYRRTFHEPTGLEPHERVLLVVEAPRSGGDVLLGGELLGHLAAGDAAGRFDITQKLRFHNELEIDVDHPVLDGGKLCGSEPDDDHPGGLIGEVRLEIEE